MLTITCLFRLVRKIVLVTTVTALAACSSPEERADQHYQSGKELLEAGNYVKAGLEFRNSIKFNEKLVDAWLGLATVQEHNGDWAGVLGSLNRVTELDPKQFEARLKLAKLQLGANDVQAALASVNAADALKANDSDVYALKSAVLLRLGDAPGAREAAERSLAINPDNIDALTVLAVDQSQLGNAANALLFVDRGLSVDPKNLGLLVMKVKIFEDTKDIVNLEATLRELVAGHPGVKQMRLALVGFLQQHGRNDEAVAELRAAVAADPSDTATALNLVNVVSAVKGVEAARKELEALVASSPSQIVYKLALAENYQASGRVADAVAIVEDIIAKSEVKEDQHRAKITLANFKMRGGDAEAASDLLDEVLAEDNRNALALGLRSQLKLARNDSQGAIGDLREALSQAPSSIPLLVLLGQAYERQGLVDLAQDQLTEAVKLSNYDPRLVIDFAAFLGRRGQGDRGQAVLEEALTKHPDNEQILVALSKVRLDRGDWEGAQVAADMLKKAGGKSVVADQILGTALLGAGRFDESIAKLKSTIEGGSSSAQPLAMIISAYLRANKQAEAEALLLSTLKANPKNADARVLLGTLRAVQGQVAEAEKEFTLAVEQQPDNPVGYGALARYYLGQGNSKKAEATLKVGYEKVPGNLAIGVELGRLHEARGDVEGAIKIYEAQLAATPDAIAVVNNLASLLADYREDPASLEKASLLARRLAGIESPYLQDTVGWVAYRRGDYKEALKHLEVASAKLPDLGVIRYHLAMTYAALGRKADAKEQLDKAKSLIKAKEDPLNALVAAAETKINALN